MRWLNGITDSTDMGLSKLQKIVKDRKAWHAAVHGVAKSCGHDLETERQRKFILLYHMLISWFFFLLQHSISLHSQNWIRGFSLIQIFLRSVR